MPFTVAAIFVDRNTVINAQWANWQVQTYAKSEVRAAVFIEVPVVGIGVKDSGIIEHRTAHVFNDRKAKLGRYPGHGLAAHRLPVLISRADVAKRETTEI